MTERERRARKWEKIAKRFFEREAVNGLCSEALITFDDNPRAIHPSLRRLQIVRFLHGPTYDAICLFEPRYHEENQFWPTTHEFADNRMWAALLIAAMTRTGDCYPDLP